uniref:B30.2/SPRY domain-containing protein n=1 Tax=Chrysemys picta bellii TaxID=8478 RepID=A0A8C3HSN5_CHRPI
CLEYFTEPVILECGHNFCRACISQCWQGSTTHCAEISDLMGTSWRKEIPRVTLQLGQILSLTPSNPPAGPSSAPNARILSPPVNVTLDPDTAHPRLVMSEDRKSVRWGDTRQDLPNNPERFDLDPCVLGCEGFTSGRHCWEVVVGVGRFWAVGVARESVRRKGGISLTPEGGYWAIRLWNGECKALSTPRTTITLEIKPTRVGIFLDYEAAELSFYNLSDDSHIYTFKYIFPGTLRPFFSPDVYGSKEDAPLTICPVIDWQ